MIKAGDIVMREIPKHKRVPWTAETAPFPLALRKKCWPKGSYLLFNAHKDGVSSVNTDTGGSARWRITYESLAEEDCDWEQRDGTPCCFIEVVNNG